MARFGDRFKIFGWICCKCMCMIGSVIVINVDSEPRPVNNFCFLSMLYV